MEDHDEEVLLCHIPFHPKMTSKQGVQATQEEEQDRSIGLGAFRDCSTLAGSSSSGTVGDFCVEGSWGVSPGKIPVSKSSVASIVPADSCSADLHGLQWVQLHPPSSSRMCRKTMHWATSFSGMCRITTLCWMLST